MLTIQLFLLLELFPFDLSGLSTIHCDCTDIVVWGDNLPSNVGKPRFSPLISSMISFPPFTKTVIVGLMLSDAGIRLVHPRAKNCRLGFQQSLSHFAYFGTCLFYYLIIVNVCQSFIPVRLKVFFVMRWTCLLDLYLVLQKCIIDFISTFS